MILKIEILNIYNRHEPFVQFDYECKLYHEIKCMKKRKKLGSLVVKSARSKKKNDNFNSQILLYKMQKNEKIGANDILKIKCSTLGFIHLTLRYKLEFLNLS